MGIRLLESIIVHKKTVKIETDCAIRRVHDEQKLVVDMFGLDKKGIEYAEFRGKKYDMRFIKEIVQFGLKGNLYIYELTLKEKNEEVK